MSFPSAGFGEGSLCAQTATCGPFGGSNGNRSTAFSVTEHLPRFWTKRSVTSLVLELFGAMSPTRPKCTSSTPPDVAENFGRGTLLVSAKHSALPGGSPRSWRHLSSLSSPHEHTSLALPKPVDPVVRAFW